MDILILFIVMLVLLLLKMPVAFSLGITAIVALLTNGIPLELIVQRMFTSINQFTLLAVPLYIFVGEAMNVGGITERMFNFSKVLLGHVRGGLGHVNVLGSVIFAGMSGAAVADAAGIGAVELKAMRDAGYDADFSAAITAASSTIGPIIPPSIPMVVYAVLAEQSVGRLFLGGIIPGLMMGIALSVIVYFVSKKRNYPIEPRASFKQIASATWKAFPALLTPVIILFGVFSGVISPTESAAIAALYALFLGFVIYRELSPKVLWQVIKKTVVTSSTILIIIGASAAISWFVVSSGTPAKISSWLFSFTQNKYVMMLMINVVLLFLGCFLESNAILLIMVPILLPIANQLGISLVAFGVIVVLNCMTGLITPPFGMCLFITADLVQMPISKLIKPMLMFLIPLLVVLLLISFFPEIVTFLPNMVMGAE